MLQVIPKPSMQKIPFKIAVYRAADIFFATTTSTKLLHHGGKASDICRSSRALSIISQSDLAVSPTLLAVSLKQIRTH